MLDEWNKVILGVIPPNYEQLLKEMAQWLIMWFTNYFTLQFFNATVRIYKFTEAKHTNTIVEFNTFTA